MFCIFDVLNEETSRREEQPLNIDSMLMTLEVSNPLTSMIEDSHLGNIPSILVTFDVSNEERLRSWDWQPQNIQDMLVTFEV